MGEHYPHQWHVAADVAIFANTQVAPEEPEGLSVLLIERKNDPYKGKLALPGGFVETSERLDQAAARELAEETGVELIPGHLQQVGAYWYPERDPRGQVLSVAFVVILQEQTAVRAGDDAVRANWYPLQDVLDQSSTLAFDHEQILRDALARLR